MPDIEESKVRDLAFHLWEDEGRPEGKDQDFWYSALKILAEEDHEADALEAELADPKFGLPKAGK